MITLANYLILTLPLDWGAMSHIQAQLSHPNKQYQMCMKTLAMHVLFTVSLTDVIMILQNKMKLFM